MVNQRIMNGARFAVFGNCVVSTWSGPTRTDLLAVFDTLMSDLAPSCPDGVLMVVVLEQGCTVPTAPERKEAEATYARWGPSIRAVAQVVEGGNLWAVTARSIMTAMRLVQRRAYPIKVFSDVREGTAWASGYLTLPPGTKGDGAQLLLSNIQQLRALSAPKVA